MQKETVRERQRCENSSGLSFHRRTKGMDEQCPDWMPGLHRDSWQCAIPPTPAYFPALSSIPMGSSEFPHVFSQEGQGGHICVWQGVADKYQLQDPAWPKAKPLAYQLQQQNHRPSLNLTGAGS